MGSVSAALLHNPTQPFKSVELPSEKVHMNTSELGHHSKGSLTLLVIAYTSSELRSLLLSYTQNSAVLLSNLMQLTHSRLNKSSTVCNEH